MPDHMGQDLHALFSCTHPCQAAAMSLDVELQSVLLHGSRVANIAQKFPDLFCGGS